MMARKVCVSIVGQLRMGGFPKIFVGIVHAAVGIADPPLVTRDAS